jgi:hypothetical protein
VSVQPAAPAGAADPSAIACPRCGRAVPGDRAWCLECGAAARTRLAPTPGWRAPVALALAVAALAVAGLAIGFVALTDDDEAGETPTTQTTAPPTAPPTTTPVP